MTGMSDLELHLADSVDRADYHFLAEFLSSEWNLNVTAEMMKSRMRSGALFIVAYADLTEQDISCMADFWEKPLAHGRKFPIGIVQTTDIITDGDYSVVPGGYDSLTNGGVWHRRNEKSDTLILADITVLRSRRGRDGNGEASRMVNTAKGLASAMYCHVWTYTPDIEAVKRWHMGNGARDTGHKIRGARPNYAQPDVNVMEYCG